MQFYRYQLKLESNYLTPFHADTLFGSLMWMYVYKHGEKRLQQVLKDFESSPPFVLSDGFPSGFLPKPFIPFKRKENEVSRNPVEVMLEVKKGKKIKRVNWLPYENFKRLCRGEEIQWVYQQNPVAAIQTIHAVIDRTTGRSLSENGIYQLTEYQTKEQTIDLYVRFFDNDWIEPFESLLNELGRVGFGKKKAVGKGKFRINSRKDCRDLDQMEDANTYIALSSFVPARNDSTKGIYRTSLKQGMLGESYSLSKSPFKKPLLQINVGSVFQIDKSNKYYCGRMVEHISTAHPEVVQYGYALTVPAKVTWDN